ncbi:unnamed protein product [Amoebophrya sp. A25]|nr:unnamed protein product [Amoebophrya sp. A25]|eukprot:GSA25T00006007001.1
MLTTAARTVCRKQNRAAREFRHQHSRQLSGVKLLEERGKAAENIYFSQEDQRLMKKLLEQNPDLDAKYNGAGSGDSTEEKIKLVFLNHGIPPLNKALIADLVVIADKAK